MSAPTPAPGDDRPREGYYPDPSIPGYVRYWNGAAWVPGTSRPAPSDGEPLASPSGSTPATPSVEETGPHFFDEDPEPQRSEPASAWGADRSHQSGFGGDQDRRVSWGADPRIPSDTTSTDGTATIPPAARDTSDTDAPGTFVFRRVTEGQGGAAHGAGTAGGFGGSAPQGASGGGAGHSDAPGIPGPGPAADEGTMTFRAVSQRTGRQGGAQGGGTGAPASGGAQTSSPAGASGGPAFSPKGSAPAPDAPGFGAGKAAAERAANAQNAGAQAAGAQGVGAQGGQGVGAPAAGAHAQGVAPAALSGPQQASRPQSSPQRNVPQSSPTVPPQAGAPQPVPVGQASAPMAGGAGGGQSSWAQQVHRLAGADDDQPVAPWKPPVEDIFQAAARRQAAARPAGLGKRLAARLLDTLVVGAITAVAAVPLGTKAVDHINGKIDEAKLSGRTVTVWLLDGTTSVYFGIVLAVLLIAGVLYEALPTAKWGRTLGKKLLGLEVRDIEGHEPPTFGGAVRRWLVYSVPGLLGIGLVGVLWCLFDRPWHQCWHDKAARTFVAG
ncbi:RDD family protein [Streptomyces sp. NPDC005648]|uniref:RDD family protein n=1 Tax=Streptomyces sp. NPDC005648 TaxID=3157044 RepID=UPI0033B8155E